LLTFAAMNRPRAAVLVALAALTMACAPNFSPPSNGCQDDLDNGQGYTLSTSCDGDTYVESYVYCNGTTIPGTRKDCHAAGEVCTLAGCARPCSVVDDCNPDEECTPAIGSRVARVCQRVPLLGGSCDPGYGCGDRRLACRGSAGTDGGAYTCQCASPDDAGRCP
jgi:hypothetical protein